ncbi:hypothetical protein HPB51_022036 [Rhipicephalus microplus]|uniref:Uncharacterized protein n=1 Tax=Rhipicephalus microplus TaxID=6941 RepID=A0A9J6E4N3_RHIMP|nr:hypothetical protein HPB51_022036 [Rhipicephalus microplus]
MVRKGKGEWVWLQRSKVEICKDVVDACPANCGQMAFAVMRCSFQRVPELSVVVDYICVPHREIFSARPCPRTKCLRNCLQFRQHIGGRYWKGRQNTWLLVTSCILLKRVGSAEGAVQGGNSSAVAISSGTAEEVYGCMCVPKGECKDDTVTAKEKPAKVGALNECGPEQVCCFHLIVRTEKTVETHSFLFPLREAQVALAEKGEFPWQVNIRFCAMHCSVRMIF